MASKCNPDGLRRLATAVIAQAYRDLVDPNRYRADSEELRLLKPERVVAFLHSPLFYTCCHFVGFDPDAVRERILAVWREKEGLVHEGSPSPRAGRTMVDRQRSQPVVGWECDG
jgi:hypothetical protein